MLYTTKDGRVFIQKLDITFAKEKGLDVPEELRSEHFCDKNIDEKAFCELTSPNAINWAKKRSWIINANEAMLNDDNQLKEHLDALNKGYQDLINNDDKYSDVLESPLDIAKTLHVVEAYRALYQHRLATTDAEKISFPTSLGLIARIAQGIRFHSRRA